MSINYGYTWKQGRYASGIATFTVQGNTVAVGCSSLEDAQNVGKLIELAARVGFAKAELNIAQSLLPTVETMEARARAVLTTAAKGD